MGTDGGDRFEEATMEVRHRGYDLLQQYDPKYFEAFKRLYADATFSREDAALPRKTQELIMVAVCTATGKHLGTASTPSEPSWLELPPGKSWQRSRPPRSPVGFRSSGRAWKSWRTS